MTVGILYIADYNMALCVSYEGSPCNLFSSINVTSRLYDGAEQAGRRMEGDAFSLQRNSLPLIFSLRAYYLSN